LHLVNASLSPFLLEFGICCGVCVVLGRKYWPRHWCNGCSHNFVYSSVLNAFLTLHLLDYRRIDFSKKPLDTVNFLNFIIGLLKTIYNRMFINIIVV